MREAVTPSAAARRFAARQAAASRSALSAPPDDDPHWEQWTAEALDEMLDDVAHKASSLAQTVLWHHHAANHGIETPENTRRQCLDTLDDLRDLMNRDASRHPLT